MNYGFHCAAQKGRELQRGAAGCSDGIAGRRHMINFGLLLRCYYVSCRISVTDVTTKLGYMVSTIRVVTILIRGIIDRANNFVVGAIKNREGIKKKDRTMGECGDRNLHYHR